MEKKLQNPYTTLTNIALENLTKLVGASIGIPKSMLELETIRQYLELLKFFELNRDKYNTEFIDNKPVITEDNFLTLVELATGKVIGDYGYVLGNKHPFGQSVSIKGMQNGIIMDGYQIWKKEPKKYKSLNTSTILESFRETVKFLLEP